MFKLLMALTGKQLKAFIARGKKTGPGEPSDKAKPAVAEKKAGMHGIGDAEKHTAKIVFEDDDWFRDGRSTAAPAGESDESGENG